MPGHARKRLTSAAGEEEHDWPMAEVPTLQRLPDRESGPSPSPKAEGGFFVRAMTRATLAAAVFTADVPRTEAGAPPAAAVPAAPSAADTRRPLPRTVEEHFRLRYGKDIAAVVADGVQGLDDDLFAVREKHQHELQALQRATRFFAPRGGFDAETYLHTHGKGLSAEQRFRLKRLCNETLHCDEEVRVPPLETDAAALVTLLAECSRGELRLDVSPATRAALAERSVRLPEEGTCLWNAIERARRAGGLHLRLTPHGVELTDKPAPALRLLGSSGKAALFLHPVEGDKPQRVSVAYEPGSGGQFLHAEEAAVLSGPVNRFVVAPPAGKQPLVDTHKKIYSSAPPPHTDAWNAMTGWESGTVAVRIAATRARFPHAKTVNVQEGEGITHGLQNVMVRSVAERPDGTCTVTVAVNAWLDKPWSSTPFVEDRTRYLLGGTTRLTFKAADGTVLPCEECHIHMASEQLTRTFTLPGKPATVDIALHGGFSKEHPRVISFPAASVRNETFGEHGTPPLVPRAPTQVD